MASVYDLKPRFQALLRPVLAPLVRAGVRPNAVTLLTLLLSVGAGLAAWPARDRPLWLLAWPCWCLMRMALNAVDGMMAREFELKTPLGGLLNEAGDVLSDLAHYLPLAVVAPEAAPAIVFFCFGSFLSEFAGVTGQALGASRRYDGPMGKSDRAFWVSVVTLATALRPALMGYWPWAFWSMTALCCLTALRRGAAALGELRRKEPAT